MTHVKIVVNDRVEMDEDVNEWQATPPDMFKDRIDPNVRPAPWMQAVMLLFANAVQQRQSVNVKVDTSPPSFTGWTLEVKYR